MGLSARTIAITNFASSAARGIFRFGWVGWRPIRAAFITSAGVVIDGHVGRIDPGNDVPIAITLANLAIFGGLVE